MQQTSVCAYNACRKKFAPVQAPAKTVKEVETLSCMALVSWMLPLPAFLIKKRK